MVMVMMVSMAKCKSAKIVWLRIEQTRLRVVQQLVTLGIGAAWVVVLTTVGGR